MTRLTIDELEILTPDQLGKLLIAGVRKNPQDFQHLQDILTVGCRIDYRDTNGWAALHWAAMYNKIEVLDFLISEGVEVNARDDEGWTALHWAAAKGYVGILKILISNDAGGDIGARNNRGRTAWDVASEEIRTAFPELEWNLND